MATAVDATLFDGDGDGAADAYDAEVHANANAVGAAVQANEYGHNCVSVSSLVDDCSPDDA